jgi:aspartate racemase
VHPIGILAHSADGAALCFLEMVRDSARRLGEHQHPEITLSIRPMAPTLAAYARGDLAAVRAHLALTVERLAAAGCAFFACPDNTAHLALEHAGPPLALPGLHIADLVARRGAADGRRRVGLLGTRWTTTGRVYADAFARAGVELRTPATTDQALVDDVIFRELTRGVLRDESRAGFLRIVGALAAAGCDAVALSCTEIPLLVTPELSPLPTLDSTRLLAREAVTVACGELPLPAWRGGAFPPAASTATTAAGR